MSKSHAGRTAWVCGACLRAQDGRATGIRDDGGDLPPLGLVGPNTTAVAGILDNEHQCEDRWIGHRAVIGCGEEERDYATDSCEGCGSSEAGPRHAVTLWSLDAAP